MFIELTSLERMTPGSHSTFIIIGVQELEPAGAEQLLRGGIHIVGHALIQVLGIAVRPRHPHKLRHGFCKRSKILFPCFQRLLGVFLVVNVCAGSDPQQDLTTIISLSHPTVHMPAVDAIVSSETLFELKVFS